MVKAVVHKTKAPLREGVESQGEGIPQANLVKSAFDSLIWEKGNECLIEYALECPCKSKNTNQQSNCRNCGGSGFVFYNPTKTRMILHSMNMQTKYQAWSKENIGTVSITALAEQELSYMDKITDLNSTGIYSEVCFIKHIEGHDESISYSESCSNSEDDEIHYFNTIYPIDEILYIAIFNGTDNPLVPLIYGKDFHYHKNKIILTQATAKLYIDKVKTWDIDEHTDVDITVRYKYHKQYYIKDLPRETVQTNTKFGYTDEGKTGVRLPIHAVGQALHYDLNAENFKNTRLNNNDFPFKYHNFNPKRKEDKDVC